jgi:hypothetical protein
MTRYFTINPVLPEVLWSLPPRTFRALLLATNKQPASPPYYEHLYELALSLVLEAPAGPPAGPGEFLDRLHPATLAQAWGGVFDANVPWAGHPGADRLIAAVLDGKVPPVNVLLAECHNTFRTWDYDLDTLFDAAVEAGVTDKLARGL